MFSKKYREAIEAFMKAKWFFLEDNAGNLQVVDAVVTVLGTIAFSLGLTIVVLSRFKNFMNATLDAEAITVVDKLITELSNIPSWIGLLVLVIMASLAFLYFRGVGSGGGRTR